MASADRRELDCAGLRCHFRGPAVRQGAQFMAKRKKETPLNYNAEIKKLKDQGPARLYLLWGEEDYLRDSFLKELRNICAPEDDGFQIRVFKDAKLEPDELRYAIDTLPFFSDRNMVEIRELDFGKSEAERLMEVLSDIPEYSTVVFRLERGVEPDGRSKLVKFLREHGREICFTVQDQNMLVRWITRRFAYYGKGLEIEAAQRLIYLSGDQMKALIPEIEKIAAYAKGDRVTASDVNAVANRIPEADIFDLTNAIADRKFQNAAGILADLLEQRDTSVAAILSLLSGQFRRILVAGDAKDTAEAMELCNLKSDYPARLLRNSARGFQRPQLVRAIELCARADYRLKSEAVDEKLLLKETVMRIVLECEGEPLPAGLGRKEDYGQL